MKKLFSIKQDVFPLLHLAIPLALTGIVQSSSYFFETFFLAHLGKEILAAGALVSWLFATLSVILFGALSAINVLVAHKYGADDHHGIASVVRDGIVLAILSSLPMIVLCWNIAPIFLFFDQPASVIVFAEAYLHALSWGILPSLVMISILELIVGLGHVRVVMCSSISAVAFTLFFSYALIFGKFGFPALGIAGAGWGITISNFISASVIITYVLLNKKFRTYFQSIFTFKKPYFLWELITIGIPMGLMYCVEVGFFFVLTLMMGRLGTELLAANQIVMQYLGLLMSMIFSIAQAITVRMGHMLGAKEIHSALRAAYSGISISAAIMIFMAIIFWCFPSTLVAFDFNIDDPKNNELLHDTKQLLLVSPIFQILEATRISLFGALRALRDTHFTLLTSIISFWGISLPLGYYLSTQLHLGGQAIWWSMVLGAATSVSLLIFRFRSKMKHAF